MPISTGERCFMVGLVLILLSLFIGIIESHANPEEEGYCGLPPVDYAQGCCITDWNDEHLWCENVTALTEDEICYCICINGAPICGCNEPKFTTDAEWTWYLIYKGTPNEREI